MFVDIELKLLFNYYPAIFTLLVIHYFLHFIQHDFSSLFQLTLTFEGISYIYGATHIYLESFIITFEGTFYVSLLITYHNHLSSPFVQ